MSRRRRWTNAIMFTAVLLAGVSRAQAQTGPKITSGNTWALGVSAGLWDRVPTSSANGHRNGTAFDSMVERSFGSTPQGEQWAIRTLFGKGRGEGVGRPGFNYERLMVGVSRIWTDQSRPPFAVYVSAGGGVYSLEAERSSSTKASVYGALGLRASIASSPVSVGAELQVHSIGGGAFGTTTLNLRIAFR